MNKGFENSTILITVDVEDWFQVENFKNNIPFHDWSNKELRVEKNTNSLLDLFAESGVKATFFILGWVAKQLPDLVRKIRLMGHEVASHGYYHNLCNQQSAKSLRNDLMDSKSLIEDIIGLPIYGYRAPSFSINDNALKIVEECGYRYDSSFNSFGMNKRYGQISLFNQIDRKGIAIQVSESLYELPISNLKLYHRIFPWGGGGYFRLMPLLLFKLGVRYILRRDHAFLFYIHPWEVDSKQPVVGEASSSSKFRHYFNLSRTLPKLSILLSDLKRSCFHTCYQYIESLSKSGQTKFVRPQAAVCMGKLKR